jgi:hypothetical protein
MVLDPRRRSVFDATAPSLVGVAALGDVVAPPLAPFEALAGVLEF